MKSPERPIIAIDISSDEASSAGSDILDVWQGESSSTNEAHHPATTTPTSSSQDMSNQSTGGLIPKTAEPVASTDNDTTKIGTQSAMKPGSSENADREISLNTQSQTSHGTADQAIHVVQPSVPEIGLVLGFGKSLISRLSAKLVQSNLASEVSRQGLLLGDNLQRELLSVKNADPLTSLVVASGPALKPMPSASSAACSRHGVPTEVGNKQSSVTSSSSALSAGAGKGSAAQVPEETILLSGPTPKPMPSLVIVSASRHPLLPQGRSAAATPMEQKVPATTPIMPQAGSTAHVGQGQPPSTGTQGSPTWAQLNPTSVHPHTSRPSTKLGNKMPPPTMRNDATNSVDGPHQPLGTQPPSQPPHTLLSSPGFRTNEEAPQKKAPTAPRSPSAPMRYPTVSIRKPIPDDDSAESGSACHSPEDKTSHAEAAGSLVLKDKVVKPLNKDFERLERDPQETVTQPQPAPDKDSVQGSVSTSPEDNNNDNTVEGLEDVTMEDTYQDTSMLTQDPEFMTTRTKTGSLPRVKKRKACHGRSVIEVSEWNLTCCEDPKEAIMENLRKGVDATLTFHRFESNPWRISASRKRPTKQAKRSVWVSDAEFDTRYMQYDVNGRGAMNILVRRPSILGAGITPYTEAYLQSLPDPQPESTSSSRVGRNYQARIPHCDSKLQEGSIDGDDDDDADEIPCHDTIWDPVLADEAQRRGEDITGFLGKNHLLLHQELLMEVLHVCAYSVHTAEKEYERILGFRELTSSSFSAEECSLFLQFLHQNKKDWVAISRAMKRTRSEVMVHYYKWKGKEVKRNKGDNVYVNLKKGWKSDYCYICDDGGELIICDGCHRAVHPLCLTPPLKSVPKGDWFCPRCTVSPVKPVRDGPRQRCSAGNYARTPTSVCRTRPDSTTPVEGVPESPSAKRVLLDGFSECSLPASNRWDELSSTPTTSKVSKVLDVETPGSSSVGSVYSPGGD